MIHVLKASRFPDDYDGCPSGEEFFVYDEYLGQTAWHVHHFVHAQIFLWVAVHLETSHSVVEIADEFLGSNNPYHFLGTSRVRPKLASRSGSDKNLSRLCYCVNAANNNVGRS